MSRAAEGEAASLEFFAVAPASVPVLFRGSARISRAVPRFGLPYLSAKKRNRHGGRRYGQGPDRCVIRGLAIPLSVISTLERFEARRALLHECGNSFLEIALLEHPEHDRGTVVGGSLVGGGQMFPEHPLGVGH